MTRAAYPTTPDGRYFVVRGRLWRCTNPALDEATRTRLVAELMAARRAVAQAHGEAAATRRARAQVQIAKEGLGERGAVWWNDGAPDYNRHMARNTPYAGWWADAGEAATKA